MGYYRGDYYRGDGGNYYRGDPFLGGLISKVVPKVATWVGGRLGGSKARKAVGAALGVAVASKVPGLTPPILQSGSAPPINIGPLGINPGAALPGGEPLFSWRGAKKYRRMNVLNPRALKRALRRAEGFEKFARRTVNALRSGPKKFKSQSRKRS